MPSVAFFLKKDRNFVNFVTVLFLICVLFQKCQAENLTFHGIWKTSLPFLSPCRREAFIFPPSLLGKGARGLGFWWIFPHGVKSQAENIMAS
jgi:hypothetical protein